MATQVQNLQNISKGDFMCWDITSQCYNLGTVVIKDDSTVYVTVKKTSTDSDLQLLAQGSAVYQGGANLRVEITIPASSLIDIARVGGAILDRHSNNVGFVYNYCAEDSDDADYNDFYINVVSWQKRG